MTDNYGQTPVLDVIEDDEPEEFNVETILDELDDMKIQDLRRACKQFEIKADGSAEVLKSKIVSFVTGVPYSPEEDEPIKIVTKEPEPEPVDEEDLVLVKFTGTNLEFYVGKVAFGREKPFRLLTKESAEHAYRRWPNKFRPASHQEVQDFYG